MQTWFHAQLDQKKSGKVSNSYSFDTKIDSGPIKVNQKMVFFGIEMTFLGGFKIQFVLAPAN